MDTLKEKLYLRLGGMKSKVDANKPDILIIVLKLTDRLPTGAGISVTNIRKLYA